MGTKKKSKTTSRPKYVRVKKRKGSGALIAQRSFVVGVIVVVLVMMVGGVFAGLNWIDRQLKAENPRFEIQHLVVSCDGRLTEDYIREASGLHEGLNLWEFSFGEIEDKLMAVSRIESVGLERKLPHTLIVKVKERVPVARIVGSEKTKYPYMVDRYGYVLPYRRKLASLPLIKGLDMTLMLGEPVQHADIETALKIIALCESTGYLQTYVNIESLDLKYSDFIDMRLEGGIRVRMPRFSLKPKLQNLATVIKIANGQGKRVKEVDLTLDSAKVPVTYY